MNRRSIELLLLCIAAPLVIVLFAMLAITQGATLGLETLGVPLGLAAAFVVAHLSVRKFAPGADPAILPIAFALSGIGIAFITRLAPELATRQVAWFFLGVVLMVIVLAFIKEPSAVAQYKYTLMVAGFVLLLSPMIPFLGQEIYGSRIWLSIGPFSFQPGELAKICVVLFLAGYLAQNREMLSVFTWRVGPFQLPELRTLLPLIIMWGIAVLIVVFEKDLGSALMFFFVFLIMLYAASGKKLYLVVGLVLTAIAAVFLYFAFGHVQARVATWLDPFADPQDTGFQLVQAMYSMADGGLFGTGIGNGFATLIPVVESDFIFAAIAEEAGLLGAAGLLLLYLCFAIRGTLTAARAKSDVSSLIATGLTAIVVMQAFVIVGGVTRLIPLTGLTLPFVSQGGSSLLASFIIVGFLLRCSDEATGIENEMVSATATINANSVLGRVALGKRLTNVLIIYSILFAILTVNLTYLMLIKAPEYQAMANNNHVILREQHTQRGTISTYDGVVLAKSVETDDGTYERVYPAGDLAAHAVGYASTRYATSGIENTMNAELRGTSRYTTWEDAVKTFMGAPAGGNDVTLTLNSRVQQAAQDALVGSSGACIVIDATTGATLAIASSPTYDIADVEELLSRDDSESSSELFNRATLGLYAPGSTFKMVSLAAAFENDVASEDTLFDAPGTLEIGGADVTNFNRRDYGTITLARATEVSSNTAYGQLGVKIGAEKLVATAKAFGFNTDIPYELATTTSLMPNSNEMTEWETAWAAAGEPVGDHESPAGPQTTLLQMALVGCAVVNDGVIQTPYLVDSVHNVNGERTYTATPTEWRRAISTETADRMFTVLEGVVENGTGTAAQVSGITVAGKTGTAEKGDGNDDSWFVGFAETGDTKIVVAIVIEDGEEGIATVQAKNVLRTALEVQGVL